LQISTEKETDVSMQMATAEDDTALDELHDALARVKAQTHVVRLAMSGMGDERDMRAIMSSLDAITDELHQAEAMLRR
jgi:putative component of toxin-antitoxin plasmid stabilization module